MAESVLKLLTVLGIGAVELWAAIPVGLALGLPPHVTGLTAGVGAFASVMIILTLGIGVRAWLQKRHGRGGAKGSGLGHRIWSRYGVVGLGLLAPLLIGAPLGTALGISLGAPPRRLLFWMGLGIAIWSTVLTIATTIGLAEIQSFAP